MNCFGYRIMCTCVLCQQKGFYWQNILYVINTITLIRATINHNPSVLPGRWSLCHPCGRSECFLSTQSSAAASSWLKTSAVSSASRPSAASPWTWGSAVSPGLGLPLQVSHSWIVLPNTTRERLVKMENNPNYTVSQPELWNKTSALLNCSRALPLFNMNMHQPLNVQRPIFVPHL